MTQSFNQIPSEDIKEPDATKKSLARQMAELAALNTPDPGDVGALSTDYMMPDGFDADGNMRPAQIG